MSADFYRMQAEVLSPPPPFTPPPTTIYLVVAYLKDWGWRVKRNTISDEYTTEEAAIAAIGKLAPCWTHAHVVKIDVPHKAVTVSPVPPA